MASSAYREGSEGTRRPRAPRRGDAASPSSRRDPVAPVARVAASPALRTTAALIGVVLLAGTGCGPATLPGTDIPATKEAKAIRDRVSAYQSAMQERDVETLREMISRDYYENAGTTGTESDDYGYETLQKQVLPKLAENVQEVHYRVLLRDIDVEGERAWAEFEYFYRFKFVEGGQDGWSQQNGFNRLEFVCQGGEWKIVSGL